jgi:hypothetical protein
MRATHAGVPLMQSAHSFGWQRRVLGGNGGTDGGAEPSICRDMPDPTRRLVRAEHASAEGATRAGVPLMQSAHSSGWQQRAGGGDLSAASAPVRARCHHRQSLTATNWPGPPPLRRLRRRSASAVEVTITLTTLPIPAATAGALTPAARAIATTALP